jgi:membrane protease YdiL (CAAX protease family)
MRGAFGWLLFGNLISAVAWWRRAPINTGAPYWLLAGAIGLHAWRRRTLPRVAAAPGFPGAVSPRRVGAAALAGLALSSPALLVFRLFGGRLNYQPVQRLSPAALALRLLFEIPIMTALSEELLFRGYLYPRQPSARLGRRIAGNVALFTAWHLVVALRTAGDTGFGRSRPTLLVSYVGSLVSIAAGGIVFCLVRERTGSTICAAVTHWVADVALTIGARLA